MKVLLPSGIDLSIDASAEATVAVYDPTLPVPAEHADAEVLVTWGNTTAQLADCAHRLQRLRLVQALSAGTEALFAAGFADSVVIASGRSLHDGPVAEHALALTLAALRSLNTLARHQARHEWAAELGGAQSEAPHLPLITLSGADVVIWGFGSIGRALAPLLSSLGANVTGVARSGGVRDGYRVVAEDDVDATLAGADVLILILPGLQANYQVLDARRIALLSNRTWVVNVGRGSAIDEAALVDALARRSLAGAALDVFETEPLPADSPLWSAPNVIVTPHSAGGRPRGASELISQNVLALVAGRPLRNVMAPESIGVSRNLPSERNIEHDNVAP